MASGSFDGGWFPAMLARVAQGDGDRRADCAASALALALALALAFAFAFAFTCTLPCAGPDQVPRRHGPGSSG
ncbi:MAG: hypothetical protein KIT47_20885 [Rhodoferax sp.]|nr:hypothetical protein [Rhodoferax sp.]